MKRVAYVFLAEILLTGLMVTMAGAQNEPLGDYARSIRKEDKREANKKYDNDNLPTSDKISIVGNAQDSSTAEDANPGSASEGNTVKPEDSSTAPADGQARAADKDKKGV